MQATTQLAHAQRQHSATSAPVTEISTRRQAPIFSELAFIRLCDRWTQTHRDPGPWAGNGLDGRIFREFQLQDSPAVNMVFWFRGRRISSIAAIAFKITTGYAHRVNHMELDLLREVLGIVGAGVGVQRMPASITQIQWSEVGNLNGKMVLAIRWTNLKLRRQAVSLFIDAEGDGSIVHEIHFSAPQERFAEHESTVNELFRSIQWAQSASPPVGSAA